MKTIELSGSQLLALQDLFLKIHLDHFGQAFIIYKSEHCNNLIEYFKGNDDASLGRNSILELKDLFIMLENRNWVEFFRSTKRRKSLKTLDAISEAAGQGSWIIYWRKVEQQYDELWEELLGEEDAKHWQTLVMNQREKEQAEDAKRLNFMVEFSIAISKANILSDQDEEKLNEALIMIKQLGRVRIK